MSVCDEGWKNVPQTCPCFREYDRSEDCLEPMTVCLMQNKVMKPPDSCPFAAILKALPSLSPERLAVITAVAEGKVWEIPQSRYEGDTKGRKWEVMERGGRR